MSAGRTSRWGLRDIFCIKTDLRSRLRATELDDRINLTVLLTLNCGNMKRDFEF